MYLGVIYFGWNNRKYYEGNRDKNNHVPNHLQRGS